MAISIWISDLTVNRLCSQCTMLTDYFIQCFATAQYIQVQASELKKTICSNKPLIIANRKACKPVYVQKWN